MELIAEKKSVCDVLGGDKNFYLIPDYQRPYSWKTDQLLTLWEDLRLFAFQEGFGDSGLASADKEAPEYFLGAIVTYKADSDAAGRQEIIDGQQRLTSLTLLLRAFYERMKGKNDEGTQTVRKKIESCVWKTSGTAETVVPEFFKLNSDSALDEDKEEFKKILTDGRVNKSMNSNYAKAYLKFYNLLKKMEEENGYSILPNFCSKILKNVILLHIITESQNTALTVFNTINDRGLALLDSDIYKSQIYKFFLGLGKKDEVVSKWKVLEERCTNLLRDKDVSPMDELFQRYASYQMVLLERQNGLKGNGNKSYLGNKTRTFLAKDSFSVLVREAVLGELDDLSGFLERADRLEDYSKRIDNLLLALSLSPYKSYRNVLTTYFMRNKRILKDKDDEGFFSLLDRLAACIAGFSVMNLNQQQVSKSLYDEMRKIEFGADGDFSEVKFSHKELEAAYFDKDFTKTRPVAEYLMTWRALIYPEKSPKLAKGMHLEYLVAVPKNAGQKVESAYKRLGNTVLVNESFVIRNSQSCSNFVQRKKLFCKAGTYVELMELLQAKDFTAQDIDRRDRAILKEVTDGLKDRGMLRP